MAETIPVLKLLIQAEECLRKSGLWETEQPDEAVLQSKQPFALDTLLPQQWLQWIFIPKMREMIEKESVVQGFCISPYFEEVWKSESDKAELIELLHAIDWECR